MSLDELTITLSDKDGRLSVDTLIKALENALEMLRGIESNIIATGVDVRWEVVRVQMRSPLKMTLSPIVRRNQGRGRPNKTIGKRLVKVALDGISNIEHGNAPPRYFSDASIDATRRLVKSVAKEGAILSFESQSMHKFSLTERAAKTIDDWASKARLYMDYSTIEGRLEAVSVHEQTTFSVWETLTNHRVECITDEAQVKEASHVLGQRVAVSGRVSFRNHIPKSIHVEGPIRVLRPSSELPQPNDIGPVDITGGLSSEDFVRKLRNA